MQAKYKTKNIKEEVREHVYFSILLFITSSCCVISIISNTRKHVSSDIQTLRSKLKKRGAAEFFKRFPVRGVWISDETHFRVFDMASQMVNNSWRNSRLKLATSFGN